MQTSKQQTTYSVRSSTGGRDYITGPAYKAPTIHGGAGRSRVSISSSVRSGLGSGMGTGQGAGGFSGGIKVTSGSGGMGNASITGNEKFAMQNLNDRLANYLETVRNLEQANQKLEIKIKEAVAKSGPDFRDYSKYQVILDDLRRKISIVLKT